MRLNIRAIPIFDGDAKIDKLSLHLNSKEAVESFQKLLNKALNTWEDSPPEWKELSDRLEYGQVLQDYTKHVNSGTKAAVEKPLPSLGDPLPICQFCGQRGYGHMFNCPVLAKK